MAAQDITIRALQEHGLPGIRRRRKELKISKTALAEMIGTTRQSVDIWEKGAALPAAYWLPAIARALECTTDELFREDDDG